MKSILYDTKPTIRQMYLDPRARDAARAVTEEPAWQQSEAERILSEIDMNHLTPMQAFNILSDLVEKVRAKEQ